MKVYVLTVSNQEGCCRPSVYTTLEKAKKGLKDLYEETVADYGFVEDKPDYDTDDGIIEEANIYDHSFYILLVDGFIEATIYEEEEE